MRAHLPSAGPRSAAKQASTSRTATNLKAGLTRDARRAPLLAKLETQDPATLIANWTIGVVQTAADSSRLLLIYTVQMTWQACLHSCPPRALHAKSPVDLPGLAVDHDPRRL